MPRVAFLCAACQTPSEKYHRPSYYVPRFCSRACARLGAPIGAVNRKYDWTPERDAAVHRLWTETPWGRRKRAALRDPLLRPIPYGTLKWRALRLGLRHGFGDLKRPWTRAEDDILETFGGELSAESIQRRLQQAGFRRSLGAISDRLYKRYQRSTAGAALPAHAVARMLGWDHSSIVRWIDAGELRADLSGGGGRHRIMPADLARFARTFPGLLSKRPVDLATLIAMLDQHPVVVPRESIA